MFAAKCAASIALAALTASAGNAPASAQVTIDGSLPGTTAGAVPLVGGTYTIPHTSGLLIGTKNLFHSFGQFSIGTGQTADFTGPGTIQNILSRVTGGSRSDIDGQIKSSIAGANLYLMNPAGILFGPNASLNVSGSFHATTADYIKFSDGTRFTAAPGPTDSMLTIADPSAFGFLGPNANKIEVNGSQLSVATGKTLSFVAGDVSIHGDTTTNTGAQIDAPAGAINVLAIGGAGEIGLNGDTSAPLGGNISMVGGPLPDSFPFTPLYTNQLDVAGNGGGIVRIQAGQISIMSTNVSASNTGPLDSAGGVNLRANTIDLVGSNVGVSVASSGKGGNVSVYAADRLDLVLSNLGTDVFGTGNGGDVTIVVPGSITMRESYIRNETTNLLGGPVGDAGDITIIAGNLSLEKQFGIDRMAGSGIFSETFGPGKAGNISITVSDTLSMVTGLNEINSAAFKFTGNGGDISINAKNLVMDQATISSETLDFGAAGNISLVVNNLTMKNSSTVSAGTGSFGILSGNGNAGKISVTAAGSILISGSSAISTEAAGGGGNAGAIAISTGNLTMLSAGQISSTTQTAGNAGTIQLNAQNLTMSDTASISTSTFGAGNAGTVTVIADMATLTTGAAISSSAFDAGNAGVVTVNAGSLLLTGGGNITTTSFAGSSGQAGNIFVTVPGAITMVDANSYIQSQALGTGNAGNIVVAAGSLNILRDAGITTDTSTNANAGTIVVNVSGNMLIDGTGHVGFVTGITSDALPADDSDPGASIGNAGSVTVTANNLTLRNNAAISSNTNTNGNAGSVTVVVPGTLLIDGTVRTLPTDYTAISSVANNDLGVDLSSKAGNVSVTAGSLVLLANGQILADTYTNGDAGTITVNAGTLYINGSGQVITTGIISDTFIGDGRAGNVTVNAGYGLLINASKIATETGAAGNGGNIVATFGTLDMSGGASISSTSTDKGNAGSVLVGSPGVITLMGANTTIQSRATGTGEAGPVTILAGQLVLKDGASVTTEATIGGGGNISMNIDFLLYLLNSSITTTVAGGSGSGGDIFIDPEFVVLNNSKILAQAFAGNGGNITIIAKHFLQSNDSLVDASSALGISGQISISSPEADIISGTVNLPTGLGSEAKLDQRACVGPGETPVLSLVPVGRGGLVLIPDADLADPAFLVAGQDAAAPRTSALPGAALAQFAALPMAASAVNCVR